MVMFINSLSTDAFFFFKRIVGCILGVFP